MSGTIKYNGEGFDSFQVARTVAYVSQDDVHQPQLTVRETMDFAARCLGTGHKQSKQLSSKLAVCLRQSAGVMPSHGFGALLQLLHDSGCHVE
jgi:ABC-type multidrug transport system ATPase subunit